MAKRFVFLLGLLALLLPASSWAQGASGPAYTYCFNSANSPSWQPCSSANPLPVTPSAPSGTQNTNITQVGSVNIPTAPADAQSNTIPVAPSYAFNMGFNGTTWDRLRVDVNKNLQVVSAASIATATTGTLTAAAQTVIATNVSGYPYAFVTINGTYGSSAASFELSDDSGTTWYPAVATGMGADSFFSTGFGQAGTAISNASIAFSVPISGANQFRVRATTVTSGTINVRITPVANAPGAVVGSQLLLKSASSNALAAVSGNQPGDGVTNSSLNPSIYMNAFNSVFNGTTWDRSKSINGAVAAGTGTNAVGIAPTSAVAAGITPIVSASAENNHVLKNAAGNLYSAYAANVTATAGYLVILNSTTSPGDGAITPLAVCNLPANGTCSINFNPGPAQVYSTGITAVVTSAATPFTKTTGAITAFISGSVM